MSSPPTTISWNRKNGLHQWFGTVWLTKAADGANVGEVASLSGWHLQVGECGDPFSTLDGESADCMTIGQVLFDGEDWASGIVDRFGWPANPDLLIVDRIKVLEAYAGRRLGLELIKAFIQKCGSSCGFVALVAQPLQHVGSNVTATESERKTAKARLRKHYSRLGFKLVPRTNVMVLNLDFKLRSVDSREPDI